MGVRPVHRAGFRFNVTGGSAPVTPGFGTGEAPGSTDLLSLVLRGAAALSLVLRGAAALSLVLRGAAALAAGSGSQGSQLGTSLPLPSEPNRLALNAAEDVPKRRLPTEVQVRRLDVLIFQSASQMSIL